jgi:hypothetical protein
MRPHYPQDVPVRTSEARHETRSDRIGGRDEDNRNRLGPCHCRPEANVSSGEDDRNPAAYQISGKRQQLFEMALCCVVLYRRVAAF